MQIVDAQIDNLGPGAAEQLVALAGDAFYSGRGDPADGRERRRCPGHPPAGMGPELDCAGAAGGQGGTIPAASRSWVPIGDRGTPHSATPPTPPGIRVTYHGGSIGLGLQGWAFGCWLRHQWFGPLVIADRGFTPGNRFQSQ